jgi:hypothetical protein
VAYDWKTEIPGVVSVHSDECAVRDGGDCRCGPMGFRASIRDGGTNQRMVSSNFDTPLEALAWQRHRIMSQDQGPSPSGVGATPVGALIDEFLQAAEAGTAHDSTGRPYTREALRALRGGLSYVDSELGQMPAEGVRRHHVKGLVAQLRGAGVDAGRVFGVVDALNELYSYAIRRDFVGFSPVVELNLSASPTGMPSFDAPQPPFMPGGGAEAWLPSRTPLDPSTSYRPAAPEAFPTPPPFASPGYATGGYPRSPATPPTPTAGSGSGPFSAPFETPGAVQDASSDSTMQERWLWWTVRIIVLVFVLIALVLVAESV